MIRYYFLDVQIDPYTHSPLADMSCGPCKEIECEEIAEDGDEYESLMKLYKRMFESRDGCSDRTAANSGGARRPDAQQDDRPATVPTDRPSKNTAPAAAHHHHPPTPAAAADHCNVADESRIKRADRQLTAALLRHRAADGGQEGDVKHLTANLPAFKSCKSGKPGAVNASLFGLDLEHWMTASTTAGDGHDGVKRAAYDLAAAEAHCKHGGAVQAAEMAVNVEPAPNLAEVAARFGAQSYTGAANATDGAGREAGDDTPVVVVAYVGSTGDD